MEKHSIHWCQGQANRITYDAREVRRIRHRATFPSETYMEREHHCEEQKQIKEFHFISQLRLRQTDISGMRQ